VDRNFFFHFTGLALTFCRGLCHLGPPRVLSNEINIIKTVQPVTFPFPEAEAVGGAVGDHRTSKVTGRTSLKILNTRFHEIYSCTRQAYARRARRTLPTDKVTESDRQRDSSQTALYILQNLV
jgi:hypothetical protein